MPTLLRIEGFRFYFFSREGGEPPHVHVRKGGGKAKLWLQGVALVHSHGLTKAELRRIHELTQEHAQGFLQRWQKHFPR